MKLGRAFALSVLALSAASCSEINHQQVTPPVTSLPRPSTAPASSTVALPAGVRLSDIHVVGKDLTVNMPDGTQVVIPNGAVFVPQLVIGDVAYPAANVAALVIERRPVSTRLFVPKHFNDLQHYAAVALLAFPEAPGSVEESKRYHRICEAYLTTLPDAVATSKESPDLRQMVTIWPRKDIVKARSVSGSTFAAAVAECNRAVDNYDYATATAWLARVPKRAGLDRLSRGPFLIAYAPPSTIGDARAALLAFDLSYLDEANDSQRAFRIWKDEIEEDPKLWEGGWNVERWKAWTASQLDKYGTIITSAISLVPWSALRK